jgi:hypothetical protein
MTEHIKLTLITGLAFMATLCSAAEQRHVARERNAPACSASVAP